MCRPESRPTGRPVPNAVIHAEIDITCSAMRVIAVRDVKRSRTASHPRRSTAFEPPLTSKFDPPGVGVAVGVGVAPGHAPTPAAYQAL